MDRDYNAGCSSINLDGWFLTNLNTELDKWRFPATNIASGQFMIVWASHKNRQDPGAPLHTNFKLNERGGYLALVQPDGTNIATDFYPEFPPQLKDVSYGLPSDGVTNTFLAWPTPGLPNSPTVDTNPPVITWLASSVVVSADTNCRGSMPDLTGTNYVVAVDNSCTVLITQSVPVGTELALGTHEVVLAVADEAGNVAYGTNYVILSDTTPPVVLCPVDLSVTGASFGFCTRSLTSRRSSMPSPGNDSIPATLTCSGSWLGIEAHAHHEVVGIDKTKIKQEIRALKRQRDLALGAKDIAKVREIREKVHHLKHLLRKSIV